MKLKIILSHPYTLLASFFLVITSGHHMGFLYFLYLALKLPFGALYSVLGIIGILLILFNHFKYKHSEMSMEECVKNLFGAILLVISLFMFFYTDIQMLGFSVPEQLRTIILLLVFCTFLTCYITILR